MEHPERLELSMSGFRGPHETHAWMHKDGDMEAILPQNVLDSLTVASLCPLKMG